MSANPQDIATTEEDTQLAFFEPKPIQSRSIKVGPSEVECRIEDEVLDLEEGDVVEVTLLAVVEFATLGAKYKMAGKDAKLHPWATAAKARTVTYSAAPLQGRSIVQSVKKRSDIEREFLRTVDTDEPEGRGQR